MATSWHRGAHAIPAPAAAVATESRNMVIVAQVFYFVFLMMVFIGQQPFAMRTQEELVAMAQNNDGSDLFKQTLFIGFAFLLTAVQIIRNHPLRYRFTYWPLAVMLLWFFITCIWSVDPFVSFKRAMQQLIVIYITFCALSLMGPERLFQSLRAALITSLLICWISLPLTPAAVHPPTESDRALIGAWRGFFFHKNIAGAVMSMTFIICGNSWIDKRKWYYALFAVLAFVFVIGTKSKTSLALCVAMLAISNVYRLLSDSTQKRAILLLSLGFGMVAAMGLYIVYQPVVERIFADPTSFTGRVSIWRVVFAYMHDHPYLGAGFGGFWQVGARSPAFDYINAHFQLLIAHSHNGYLEIWATTGPLGLALLSLSFLILPSWWFLTGATKDNLPLMVPAFAIWVFVVYHNLLETSFFDRDRQVWVIFLAAIATAHAAFKDKPRPGWRRMPPSRMEPDNG